jgi:hypothetical protein
MKFCFYSKQDPKQEAIGACEALSLQEAVKFFSLTKMLTYHPELYKTL